MLKVNLQEVGSERSFSDEELRGLEGVLQAGLDKLQHIREEAARTTAATTEETETSGTFYEVNVASINRRLFAEAKADPKQEAARLIILEALQEADKNPAYAAFSNMMPKKTWDVKTAGELEKMADSYGGHMADWVEQSLEFAQRISDGESSWEDICNKPDVLEWYRIIWWKNGKMRLVGGSTKSCDADAPADFGAENWNAERLTAGVVPLISIPK